MASLPVGSEERLILALLTNTPKKPVRYSLRPHFLVAENSALIGDVLVLTRLNIENFKSWRKTGDFKLAPITGLFGTNSSGKTSLLQLLLMLKQTTESSDRAQVLHLGDERSLVELGIFKDVIFAHDKNASLKFDLEWGLPKRIEIPDPEKKGVTLFSFSEMGFTSEISSRSSGDNGAGRIVADRISYRFGGNEFGMRPTTTERNEYDLFSKVKTQEFRFIRTQGRVWKLPPPVKCYGFPDQVRAYYQNAGFLSFLELAFEELFSRTYYLGPLRSYPKREYTWAGSQPADMGQRGEKAIDALLASREQGPTISQGQGIRRLTVEGQVAKWLKELNLIHDFAVKPVTPDGKLFQVTVKRSPSSASVLITDVGFGVSQILPVLVLCYYVPEGSTIILEQPEIHLHPSVQAGLADVFVDAVKKRNIQIILESHSEHLLRRLQRRVAEEVIPTDSVALYFSEMINGESRLQELKMNLFGDIENWPSDFFGDDFGEISAITRAKMERLRKK